MAYAPRSGKGARVTMGAGPTILFSSAWEASETAVDHDTTNFESSGLETGIIGVKVVSYNASGLWDAGTLMPFTDPPGLYVRDDLSTLKLFTSTSDSDNWTFTVARVLSNRTSARVREAVSFDWSGKSNGAYTAPS